MSPAGVLVAYATAHGSTRGVAERIALRLREAGHAVELSEVTSVGDLAGYDAVVLGSPVYDQVWLPEARAFAARHDAGLAAAPLWLFSVGTFGDGSRLAGRFVRSEPKGIGELCRALAARDYRVFAGVIDRHQWPGPARLLFHAFGGRFGDRRDWPAIDAWATGIAGELDGRAAPPRPAARRRSWSELSRGQRRAVIALGAAQLAFQAAALIDLARRPAREVNGDRRLWAAATFVNWIGPLAYFARGRRR